MAERGEELAAAGVDLALASAEELELAAAAAGVAGDLADEAVAEAAVGGAAVIVDEVAQGLAEAATDEDWLVQSKEGRPTWSDQNNHISKGEANGNANRNRVRQGADGL